MSIPTDNEDQLSRGDIWEKARHATIKQLSILNTLRYSEAEFMDDLSALGLNIKNWRQLHALDKIREHLKAADELCDYLNLRRPQIRRSLESKIGKVKEVIAEFNARIKAPDEDDVGSRSVGELCEGVARLNNTTSIWALQLDKDRYYLNSAFRSFHLALVFWENETGAGGLTRVSPRSRSSLGHIVETPTHTQEGFSRYQLDRRWRF